jgi:hypothetical protein
MAGSKDHTDISPNNILKLTVESLTTDGQQQYEDYMCQAKEKTWEHLEGGGWIGDPVKLET